VTVKVVVCPSAEHVNPEVGHFPNANESVLPALRTVENHNNTCELRDVNS